MDHTHAHVGRRSGCLQAEIWYQALLEARPDWAGLIALHHGALSRETRDWVERALNDSQLKAVVCTSGLDLGVDFLHGPGSHASGTLSALRARRERNLDLSMVLIRGKHDKRAGDPPVDLNIEVVPDCADGAVCPAA